MNETLLLGRGRQIIEIPRQEWEKHLAQAPQHSQTRLSFMSEEHHQVRYFVVRELPRMGEPIQPELISQKLKLSLTQVNTILDELEKNLVFLVRNEQGAVSWAFPVTVDPTPHHLTFSTGEQIYAAWAEDAIATPFVQGQLQKKPLSVEIETQCGHCAQPMRITVDSELKYHVDQAGIEPLVFEPHLDWEIFTEPNIIHAYWRNSLFFWSEEHAREFRAKTDQIEGIFLTLAQSAHSTRIVQGGLFAFK